MGDFSDHIVNQRFKEVFKTLEAANLIKGKSDIANHLGTYNHVINSILKGQRNITLDQLNKLFDNYRVNANYLFGNSDQMFLGDAEMAVYAYRSANQEFRRNITLVPNKAMAGYALDPNDGEFMDNLTRFSIPNLDGDLIAFEISGDSMMPTITSGDLVVCEPVERDVPLRDNHVYVIVTDVVVAKRIQQVKEGSRTRRLRLISDNGQVYKPYDVELEDVRQILKVKSRITGYAVR